MKVPALPARVLVTLTFLAGTMAAAAPGTAAAAEESCSVASPYLTNFAVPGQQPHFYYKVEGGIAVFWIDPGNETCMNERLVVDYGTTPVAPTTGADFADQEGSVEWEFTENHGPEPNQPVTVPFTQDAFVEAAAEEVTAQLKKSTVFHAGGGSHTSNLGSPSMAPLYIVDDDGSTRVRFVVSSQSVLENAGSVKIPILRAGTDTSGSVNYEIVAGSANPATDLAPGTPTSGTFTFASDLRLGTVNLPLNNDALCEGPETLTVRFPTGTATDGPSSVTLTINDDETGCTGTHTLTVSKAGTGGGTVTSSPAGINCGLDCNENYPDGQNVALTATAAGGSVFDHWEGACTGTANPCNVTMNAAKNVTAFFNATATTHTLTVTTGGTGTGTVTSAPAGISCPGDCSQDFNDGQNVALTATAGGSSSFAGWSGNCTGTANPCNLTMNADKSVTATFNSTGGGPFTLTVSKSGSGTVTSSPTGINCGRDCSESYTSGQNVALTGAPAAGWSFSSWSGACTGSANPCNVAMNADKNVTATFVSGTTHPLNVTVNGTGSGTVTSSPAGIDCPGDCSQSYPSGQNVALTATAGGGSTFAGWSGDCTGSANPCNVTMNAARNVTATFNTGGGGPFTLTVAKTGWGGPEGTVTSSPAGISCGADCSQSYTSGTNVTLTATPSGGFVFDHWEGDCGGTSTTCNVAMGSDKLVIAAFDDVAAPESDFHHPKQNHTYDYDDEDCNPICGFLIREVHVFTDDFGGSGVDAADGAGVEIALRRKLTDNTCEWWNGSGFTPGPCNSKVWHAMTEYDVDAYFYNFPEMQSSVNTNIMHYRAWARATDAAGNLETIFETGRNSNQFEIAPNSP